jgi:polyisoprenyl-phosphate glycosyltransferase
MEQPYISIVSPVYGCKDCLYELYYRLEAELIKITSEFEIILVDDGSPDGAWETIIELGKKDNRVKGINLSRNFGQHNALTAGLEHCSGDWVVVLDCDLQDKPEEISKLYNKATEGYDIVLGKRNYRKDNLIKRVLSKLFYKILSFLTDTKHDYSIANFGIYKKKVIDSVLRMNDNIRYFPTMIHWVGFKSIAIEVVHAERSSSKSGYTLKKLLKLALDIILSFSEKPLILTILLGLVISLSSFIFAIYYFIQYLRNLVIVPGWTSLIVSIWFLSGIIIFVLGIVGLYVGKTFEKAKSRPLYLITEMINFK